MLKRWSNFNENSENVHWIYNYFIIPRNSIYDARQCLMMKIKLEFHDIIFGCAIGQTTTNLISYFRYDGYFVHVLFIFHSLTVILDIKIKEKNTRELKSILNHRNLPYFHVVLQYFADIEQKVYFECNKLARFFPI